MSILVGKAKEQISSCILSAAESAMADGSLERAELTEFSVSVPADRSHGDYAANAAMVWARLFKSAPRAVAEKLCSRRKNRASTSACSISAARAHPFWAP